SLGSVGTGGLAAQVRAALTTVQVQSPAVSSPRPDVPQRPIDAPRLTTATSPAPVDLSAAPSPLAMRESRANDQAPALSASPPSFSIATRAPSPSAAESPTSEAASNPAAGASLPDPVRAAPSPAAVFASRVSLAPGPSEIRVPALASLPELS